MRFSIMAHEIVETPEATFVLMFTRSHGADNNPIQPVPFERSPRKPDALLVETGFAPAGRFTDNLFGRIYTTPLTQAYRNKAEVWFGDVPPTRATVDRLQWSGTLQTYFGLISGLAIGAGGYWAAKGVQTMKKKKRSEKKQERRGFLKTTVVGGFVGWLGAKRFFQAELSARGHTENIENPKYWKFMTKLHEFFAGFGVGPARNAVIAEKMHSVLIPDLRKKLGRKPVVVVAMGMNHYGIKQMLVDHEHRRRVIKENDLGYYLTKPFDDAYRGNLDLDKEQLPLKPKLERIPKALSPQRKRPVQQKDKKKQGPLLPGQQKIGRVQRSLQTPRSVSRKNALNGLPQKRRRRAA
jgi:hypothetical protein